MTSASAVKSNLTGGNWQSCGASQQLVYAALIEWYDAAGRRGAAARRPRVPKSIISTYNADDVICPANADDDSPTRPTGELTVSSPSRRRFHARRRIINIRYTAALWSSLVGSKTHDDRVILIIALQGHGRTDRRTGGLKQRHKSKTCTRTRKLQALVYHADLQWC